MHQRQRPRQPNLGARIASYELAARMQLAATDALDISRESPATREMYGVGREPTDSYGRRCLIARRLLERVAQFRRASTDVRRSASLGEAPRREAELRQARSQAELGNEECVSKAFLRAQAPIRE